MNIEQVVERCISKPEAAEPGIDKCYGCPWADYKCPDYVAPKHGYGEQLLLWREK